MINQQPFLTKMDEDFIKYMLENANKCIECKDYIHPSRNEIICTRCRKQNELLEEMKKKEESKKQDTSKK
jgi:hypothetical protein